MRQAATTVLGLEIALVIGFAAVYRPFDLNIYLWGGRAVTHGLRLYLVQPDANWFTYPPFAAALFTPLAAIPAVATKLAWELGSVAALAWACALTLKLAGRRPSAAVTVAMVAAGADPGRP
jgi:alpha-1,2-mannosyltransferase